MKNKIAILSLVTLFFVASTSVTYAITDIQGMLWTVVVGVFGRIMTIAGFILDIGINEFVIGFGKSFLDSGVGITVENLWKSIRDIFNLTFIFGLVYIGFKLILGSDDSNTKKWLISLIMAALLVNFSLYITKLVVDFSNITATQIVINGFGDYASPNKGISDYFMDRLNLQSVYTKDLPKEVTGGEGALWSYIFGTAFIFIIAAYAFAVGGMLLIVRFAALILFMILSPFMFIGWVFPSMQKYTDMYWKQFIGRAFFAPVYLLLLYFAAKVIDAYYAQNILNQGEINYMEMLSGHGSLGIGGLTKSLAPFLISCIFLLAAAMVGKKMGADGADYFSRIAKNTGRRATRLTGRGAKYLAANTAGRGARIVANKAGDTVRRRFNHLQATSTKFDGTVKGNVMAKVGEVARSNGLTRFIEGATGAAKNSKFGIGTTQAEDQAYAANTATRSRNTRALIDAEDFKVDDENKIYDPVSKTVVDRSKLTKDQIKVAEEARTKALAEAQSVINNLSQTQLEEMLTTDKDMFDGIIENLKSGQFSNIMSSDKINSTKKLGIFSKRQKSIAAKVVDKKGNVFSQKIQRLSISELETLGNDFITKHAHELSQSQMDGIMRSESFTEDQAGSYIAAGKKAQIDNAWNATNLDGMFQHNDNTDPTKYVKAKKAAEIANIPFAAFIDADKNINTKTIKQLTGDALAEIFAKQTMTSEQRTKLKGAIQQYGNSDAKGYLDGTRGQRDWGGSSKPSKEKEPVKKEEEPVIVDASGKPLRPSTDTSEATPVIVDASGKPLR